MSTQCNDRIVVMSIPLRTRLAFKRASETNNSILPIFKWVIEWTMNQFINAKSSVIDDPTIRKLHDEFIDVTYPILSEFERGYKIKKTVWEEESVTVTFSTEEEKWLPAFWRVKELLTDFDFTHQFENQGIVFNYLPESQFGAVEASRKPAHFIAQEQFMLDEGIHTFRTYQNAYDQSPIRLDGVFFVLRNDNASLDFFMDDLRAAAKGQHRYNRPAPPVIEPVESDDDDDLPWNDGPQKAKRIVNPTSFQPTKVNGKVDWKKQSHTLMADGKFYRSPHKCANDKRIDVKKVYGRLYSKESKWAGWYFTKRQ